MGGPGRPPLSTQFSRLRRRGRKIPVFYRECGAHASLIRCTLEKQCSSRGDYATFHLKTNTSHHGKCRSSSVRKKVLPFAGFRLGFTSVTLIVRPRRNFIASHTVRRWGRSCTLTDRSNDAPYMTHTCAGPRQEHSTKRSDCAPYCLPAPYEASQLDCTAAHVVREFPCIACYHCAWTSSSIWRLDLDTSLHH